MATANLARSRGSKARASDSVFLSHERTTEASVALTDTVCGETARPPRPRRCTLYDDT